MSPTEFGGATVGRDAELAVLASVLDRLTPSAHAARPMVHIVGEPGIGKSALLDALVGLGAARGVPMVVGRATEFEAHAPFAAVTDALDEPLAEAIAAGRVRLDRDEVGRLAQVFPALEPDSWPPEDAERHRLFRSVRMVLESLAGASGLVVAFDDVHWADQATLELLRYLARRPPAAPVLMVLAFRPRQLDAAVVAELTGPVPEDAIRLELGPLNRVDADTLLGAGVAVSRRRELYQASGGNPLYLTELARGDDDQLADIDPFQRELATLPERELLLLRAAAVAGADVDLGMLAAVAELPVHEAAAALETLVARDLLRPNGSRWRHRHPLLRHVVYTHTPPGWRLAAHCRAVDELALRGESNMMIAEHLSRCASPGNLWAIERLADAAAQAMRIAPASAAHWLGVALRLLPVGEETAPQRVAMLAERVTALHRSGQLAEARTAVHDALAAVTPDLAAVAPGMAAERTRLVGLAATVERLLGRHDEARALLRAELDRHPPAGDTCGAASGLLMELVVTSVLTGDFTTAQQLASSFVADRDVGSVVRAANLALTAMATSAGQTATLEHVARLVEADAVVDALTDAELGTVIEIPVWLGLADIQADRLTEAHRHLSRGLVVATRTGQHQVFTYLKLLLSSCAFGFGALDEAAAAAEDALDAALLAGNDQFVLMALLRLGNITAWQGDIAAAEEVIGRAERLAASSASIYEGQVQMSRAVCHWVSGRAEDCVTTILDATNGGDFSTVLTVARVDWLELLAEAEIALGHPDLAADWAKHADEASTALPFGRQRGLALLAKAWAALPGSPSAAAAAALPAIALLREAGDRLSLARALLFASRTAVESDDPAAAVDHLEQARAAAQQAGAHGLVAQIDAARHRISLAGPGKPDDLTDRERTIVDLILAGHTNREIATRLYLSTRSVEASLSRIYAKLGVRGRTRLIAHLTRDEF
ncbi:MAG TPA: AAA family ATPase [Pseudonocardiaceae bacterium]|nr:AAA family ATPase [Pseudonocardiaceae bacterium]